MNTFLLLWNASEESYASDTYEKDIQETRVGREPTTYWSFGGRINDFAAGDRVFLLRQRKDRGIVASGHLTDDHLWEFGDDSRAYVRIKWDTVVPIHDRIAIETLFAEVPGHHWNTIYSSGQMIADTNARLLEDIWATHTGKRPVSGKPRNTGDDGQGFVHEAERRRSIENYAQDLVMTHMSSRGFSVEDTRVGNPYDFLATKGKQRLFCEAKGTQSTQPSVMVTTGEVEHARKNPGKCVLGVVTDIKIDTENRASGGTLLMIDNWDPDDGRLTPTQYRHIPRHAASRSSKRPEQ